MAWRMARSLELLLAEVNARWPGRDKDSDGGIGDPSHSSRKSDHNPNADGVVCARDFDEDGIAGSWLAEHLRLLGKAGDPRVKYVIYEGLYCSAKTGWEWAPYDGVNAHKHHLHLSVGPTAAGYDSPKRWGVYPALSADEEFGMDDEAKKAFNDVVARLNTANSELRQVKAAVAASDANNSKRIAALEEKLAKSHPGID